MTGAVLSETDQTGRKLKTFVPANGTTLAEQELVTIGSTTTEKLTFIHQDPSLASLQRTDNAGNLVNSNARAGEYDALGRNVADAGPYVTLNTDPPVGDSGGSGINLDGTAQGYRPGRGNYLVDGQTVPENYFMERIYSGRIGGPMGLLDPHFRFAGYSVRTFEAGYEYDINFGSDFNAARDFAIDHLQTTVLRNFYSISWGIAALGAAASNGIKVSLGGTDEARNALQSVLTQECDSKLTQVLAQLRVKDGRDNPLRSDTILGLFDKLVAQTKGGIWFDKTQEEFRNLLNSVSPGTDDVAGGGGVTLGVYEKGSRGLKNAAMFVGVFPRDVSTLGSGQGPATEREMSRRIAQAKRALLLILIHEIAHAAGQHQTFDHDEMNQAAKIVDEGVNDFEQFVTKHCEVGTYVPKYDAR